MLIICCEGFQLSCGVTLKCTFKNVDYDKTKLYSCSVNSLENMNNDMIISGYTGDHIKNKFQKDVEGLHIFGKRTKYIPTNLGLPFNLTALRMKNTQLVDIKNNNFRRMQELYYLSLKNNKLTSLPSDAFSRLTKLRIIYLSINQIEELPKGLFFNNLNLEEINFDNNKIRYIESGMFDGLTKLNKVNLTNNICVSKLYIGPAAIDEMKNDIKLNCSKSNTNPTLTKDEAAIDEKRNDINLNLTSETTTTTRNLLEHVEMQKQITSLELLINELKKELSEAKNKITEFEFKTQEITAKLENCELNQQVLIANMSMSNGFNSFIINCKFQKTIEEEYACETQDLIIHHKDMKLNEVTGVHHILKSNQDVMELIIMNSSVSFWSNNIFKTFPALQTLSINNAKLEKLSKGDFNYASNLKNVDVRGNEIRVLGNHLFEGAESYLTKIVMNSNKIEKLFSKTFQGLGQLKVLSLRDNLIAELQLGIFCELINLKTLIMSSNKLKFLDGQLLQFNTELVLLRFNLNNLIEIGTDILDYSTKLKTADFSDNKCIDENSADADIEHVIDEIKTHCNIHGTCNYMNSIMNLLI